MRHGSNQAFMRLLRSEIAPLAVALSFALSAVARGEGDLSVGSTYDIVRSVELRDGPGQKYDKKINQKASDSLRRIEYMSVDSSTTVKLLDVKGDWAEVQVVEPTWLADTHRGWIPLSALKRGKATHKRDGWVKHTCLVYSKKDTKSKTVGYLEQRAALSVVDDGSGWLQISMGDLAPVMDPKTNDLLDEACMKGPMYIEESNFTEIPPGRW